MKLSRRVGTKPSDDPSLADDQAEFHKLNDELFGDGTGVRNVGKGKVYSGQGLAEVFGALKVAPDFDYTRPEADTRLLFVHRKLADGDLYLVDNRTDRDETVDATFRVAGKAPELWHPEAGNSEPVSYQIADGRTTVLLHREPWGTVFVVFRQATQATSRTLPKLVVTPVATVEGAWNVAFEAGRGAPASITLDRLISWPDSTDAGVKYFSGAGTYTNTIEASPNWFKKGAHLWIDLGDVKNLAEVTVNGKPLGIVWYPPYRVDVTGALRPGANEGSIKVINAWVNRLIGDQQPDATTKYSERCAKRILRGDGSV
ncbi:MAG: glycosylhydrolase-like jelly roll fold domain-containing protein [Terriglobia bacterium]